MASQLPAKVGERLASLPTGLRDHIERVRGIARELAASHGVDPRKADLAAACHDLMRAEDGEALRDWARRLGVDVHPVEEMAPVLLHGRVASAWLRREGATADADVLDAIDCHSTGHPNLGPVAKVLILADRLDPAKAGKYPEQEALREVALRDLDAALLGFLDRELATLISRGHPIHPETVALRNDLLLAAAAPARDR